MSAAAPYRPPCGGWSGRSSGPSRATTHTPGASRPGLPPTCLAQSSPPSLASAGAAFAIRLWEADLKSPFSYTDDGLLMLSLVKMVLGEGWWFTTSSLGFPFGQELYDYPFAAGNTLHILGLAGLGVLLGDPVLVLNVFFLLSFPLIAVVAFLVFRRLGISIVVSVFAGSVFAILPYHFARNVDHLFLSS